MRLSQRLDNVHESATLKMNALAQSLIKQGQSLINLTAGEPDFPVVQSIKEAVSLALLRDQSHYTLAVGNLEVREAVASKTGLQQNLKWEASEVILTNGGKQALFNAFLAILNPGDQVLIPSPFWPSYPEMVKLVGGSPVQIRTALEQGFKLSPQDLSSALKNNPRSKMLILNSPNNPTGALYSLNEFKALAEVLHREAPEDFIVLSDEIYDRITYEPHQFCSFLKAAPEWKSRTITVNGLSKGAAMPGWRVGWSVAAAPLTQAMAKIQGQTTSGISSLSQAAALAALELPEKIYKTQVESYQKRSQLSHRILSQCTGLMGAQPAGAFYHFMNCENFIGPDEDSFTFCERVLRQAKVALVPGEAFGEASFVRMSFAVSEELLTEACNNLVQVLR